MDASYQHLSVNKPLLTPTALRSPASSAVSVEHNGHTFENIPPHASKPEIANIILTWKEHAASLQNNLKQQESAHTSLNKRVLANKEFASPELLTNFFKAEGKINALKEDLGKINHSIITLSKGLTPDDFKAAQGKKDAQLAEKYMTYEKSEKGVSSGKIQEKIQTLEKNLEGVTAKLKNQEKLLNTLKEITTSANPKSIRDATEAEHQLREIKAEKKGIEQTIVLYQDDKTSASNQEFKIHAYVAVKKGLNYQDLLFGAASFKSLSNLFSDLRNDKLNRQESLNVLNFIHDYLTKGLDLPADASSKAKLQGELLNLCQHFEKDVVVDGLRDHSLSEKLVSVRSTISQKLDSPSLGKLMNLGKQSLEGLNSNSSKTKNANIDSALRFLEQSNGVDDNELKTLRNQVSNKLQEMSKNYSFTKLSAKELAEDVCSFFENEFKQIAGNELNNNNWTRKETREQLSPHLSNLIKGSNEIKAKLAEAILKAYAESPDKGNKLYNKCLEAAGIALENKNFQAFETLKAAISTPSINRLHLDDKLSSSKKKMYGRFTSVDLIRKEIPAMEKHFAAQGKTYVPLFVLRMGQLAIGIEGNNMHSARLEVLSKIKAHVKSEQTSLKAKPISVKGNPLLRAQLAFTQERSFEEVDNLLEGLSSKVKPPRSAQVK